MTRIAFLLLLLPALTGRAQLPDVWNHRQCAVVLTYDDAIDADLDRVIPALDSVGLKGTFYIIGSSPVVSKRLGEWRKAAGEGHELGNHALFHPCDGSQPGRSWVQSDFDLSRYTVRRAVEEIRVNNTLLQAIDGRTVRTFAYPCGDLKIGDTLFYRRLENDFAGARGVIPGMQTIDKVDLDNIQCYGMNGDGDNGERMIGLVKAAMQTHTLLVFLFHGVGGGHNINVSSVAHSQLLHFLKDHEKEIWIAPMVDVAERVRAYQQKSGH